MLASRGNEVWRWAQVYSWWKFESCMLRWKTAAVFILKAPSTGSPFHVANVHLLKPQKMGKWQLPFMCSVPCNTLTQDSFSINWQNLLGRSNSFTATNSSLNSFPASNELSVVGYGYIFGTLHLGKFREYFFVFNWIADMKVTLSFTRIFWF